jgi:diguanylate cyclase (GGDEF)-like protein/PAS domain S-box-containing protein
MQAMNRILAAVRLRHWSIKYRIAFAVALLFVVMVALTNALQMRLLREDMGRVLSEQQFSLVQRTAREIDSKFETGISVLAGTAAFISDADMAQPARLREELHQKPGLLSFFDDLLVLNPAGRLVADYPELPGRTGVDASDRAFFRDVVRTHQTVISEPLLGKTRGEPVVQVATPILTLDDRLVGVVVGVIRLYRSSLLGRLGEERIGETGYFAVMTRGPKPIYVVHPDRTRILKERPANGSDAVTNAINGYEGSSEGVSSTGADTIYSSKLLKTVPWVIVAAAPKAEVLAPLEAARRRGWIITGIATAALIPIAWYIVWLLLGPLRHLSASMVGLREGEGHFVPIPVRRADEVGELTTRFNLLMHDRFVAEKARADSEERMRLLANNIPALVSYIDSNLRVVFANSAYRDWFGLDPEKMNGKRVDEIFDAASYELTLRHLGMALAGEATTFEREVDTRKGARTVRTSFFPQFGDGGMVVGVNHMSIDISEDRKVQAQLDALARRDSLTGLYNRRSFEELLPQAVARSTRNDRKLALLFLDLDHFKAVNDTQGHDAGDEVLKSVAQRLTDCVRLSDTVARLGGDEFVVVLEDVHAPGDAATLATKIIASIGAPIETRAGSCTIGASIGIAMCDGKDVDCKDLLKRADRAHYEAKGAGRGRFHLDKAAE